MEERSPASTVAMTPSMLSSRIVSYTLDIRPCMCVVRVHVMHVQKNRERAKGVGEEGGGRREREIKSTFLDPENPADSVKK